MSKTNDEWMQLISDKRLRELNEKEEKTKNEESQYPYERDEAEKDYGRVLFSTPFRRLADKTQVFPLEKNDSVRTRLTHSCEVASLARNFGINIAEMLIKRLGDNLSYEEAKTYIRRIPAILATIGLAHDIGNPPFGHQGENAIRKWIKNNNVFNDDFLKGQSENNKDDFEEMKQDYLCFDGNAQTFRVITRLQIRPDNCGLNLTCGTLAAIIKYAYSSLKCKEIEKNKFGYFYSEKDIVKKIWQETGLEENRRHPLTYVMEACDDIAYCIIDLEDAVKKKIISFEDIISDIEKEKENNNNIKKIIKKSKENDDEVIKLIAEATKKNEVYRKEKGLSSFEVNDLSIQRLRAFTIDRMVKSVLMTIENMPLNSPKEMSKKINEDKNSVSLMEKSTVSALCKILKNIGKRRAYSYPSVIKTELDGYIVITKLMDYLWYAITKRDDKPIKSERSDPFAGYVYNLISENYRRVAEQDDDLPIRYKEVQLLVDMISGMTDSYAVDLYHQLHELYMRYPTNDAKI